MNRVPFKRPQHRVVFAPGGRRQLGLEANVFQELLGIEPVFGGDARQQQPPKLTTSNLQAVLADLDSVASGRAAKGHQLLIRQQPDFDVAMRQLPRRNSRKAMIFSGGPAGRMNQRLGERNALTQKAAAASQSPAPLQAD